MIKPFDEIHRVLHRDLKPAGNNNERAFREKLQQSSQSQPAEVAYQIAFPPAIDHKTMWYHRFLTGATNHYCHYLTHEIGNEEEESVRLLQKTLLLDRTFPSLLKQVGDVIAENGFSIKKLVDDAPCADKEWMSSLYIYQLVKVCLAKCYLTAQDLLGELVETHFSEADIYRILVGEWGEPQLCLTAIANDKTATDGLPVAKIGFTYIYLDTHADYLNDFFDSLKKAGKIADETKLTDFKQLFKGKPVATPVRWTGGINALYYLIVQLHNDSKLVKELRVQELWNTACRCFVQPSGEPFDKDNLRKGSRPKRTADIIETCVAQLVD